VLNQSNQLVFSSSYARVLAVVHASVVLNLQAQLALLNWQISLENVFVLSVMLFGDDSTEDDFDLLVCVSLRVCQRCDGVLVPAMDVGTV
jgi:hypothetical protein